jgi:hypothetical protein
VVGILIKIRLVLFLRQPVKQWLKSSLFPENYVTDGYILSLYPRTGEITSALTINCLPDN